MDKASHNWQSECDKLREQMKYMESQHNEEKNSLKLRIAELERDLMIYEQKWSVITLIFGK